MDKQKNEDPGIKSGARLFGNSLKLIAVLSVIFGAEPLQGGPYFSFGLRSAQFAAKPILDEPTPNYYAVGPRLGFGYSIRQILDAGLFGSGLLGNRKQISTNGHDAHLFHGGIELALRLAKSIYLGVYGGQTLYELKNPSAEYQPGIEWAGSHKGLGGGSSVGALVSLSKESFLLVSLDFEQHQFDESSPDKNTKRVLECFGITLAYHFNSYKSYLIDNTIFKDFLDSMYF